MNTLLHISFDNCLERPIITLLVQCQQHVLHLQLFSFERAFTVVTKVSKVGLSNERILPKHCRVRLLFSRLRAFEVLSDASQNLAS